MNINVSIPVTLGGYTGQRDAWEVQECHYSVTYDEDSDFLTLFEVGGTLGRRITIPWAELQEAVAFAAAHQP